MINCKIKKKIKQGNKSKNQKIKKIGIISMQRHKLGTNAKNIKNINKNLPRTEAKTDYRSVFSCNKQLNKKVFVPI